MSVTFDIPKEIEAQFTVAAQARGVPLSDYVLDFVVKHYQEDADDMCIAKERPPRRSSARPDFRSVA